MSVSDITCAALTATPSVRGNKLAWTYSDPRSGALPNIALDVVEVWSATVNDRADGSFAKVGEGITNFLHSGLVEEQTYYYWVRARDKIGGFGAYYPSGATSGVSCVALGLSGLAFVLANGKLVASVASNALTIAVKTAAGNDPTASDTVFVAFRNATLTTGNYVARQISAALSLVVSSGSTMGTSNSTAFRLWVVLFDDAGTLRLGVINCSSNVGTTPISEQGVASSTAEGGAGGADSLSTFYTGTAVTSKPFRIIGFLEWTSGLATAGTWSAGPDIITLQSPGGKVPGDVVQRVTNSTGGYSSGVADIPFDNTPPLSSEGTQVINVDIVPTSPANLLENEFEASLARSTAGPLIVALIKNETGSSLRTVSQNAGADVPMTLGGHYTGIAGATSSQRFTMRLGATGGATLYVNGNSGGQLFSSTLQAWHAVSELMS